MAMLNWQGWAANWLGWGSEGPAASTTTAPSGVGRGGKRKRRVALEWRGKTYHVDSEQAVFELLAVLENQAKVSAEVKARRVVAKKVLPEPAEFIPPASPQIDTKEIDNELWQAIQEANRTIQATWEGTFLSVYAREVARRAKEEQDDDELSVRMLIDELFRI